MNDELRTPSHPGLRAWFEVLRTERDGQLHKYWVDREYQTTHCSNPECVSLTIGRLAPRNWELKQAEGTGHLYAFRHHKLCSWREHVNIDSQTSFTSQPLERAYVYWARFEHEFNHK